MGFTIIHGNAGTFEQQQATAQGFNTLAAGAQAFGASRDRKQAAAAAEQRYQAEIARAQEQQAYNRERQAVVDDRNTTIFDQTQADRAGAERGYQAQGRADRVVGALSQIKQDGTADIPLAILHPDFMPEGVDDLINPPSPLGLVPGRDFRHILNDETNSILNDPDLSNTSRKLFAQDLVQLQQGEIHQAASEEIARRAEGISKHYEGIDDHGFSDVVESVADGSLDPEEADAMFDQAVDNYNRERVREGLRTGMAEFLGDPESLSPEVRSRATAIEKQVATAKTDAELKDSMVQMKFLTGQPLSQADQEHFMEMLRDEGRSSVPQQAPPPPPPVGGGADQSPETRDADMEELLSALDDPDGEEAATRLLAAFNATHGENLDLAQAVGSGFVPAPPAEPTPVADALGDIASEATDSALSKAKWGAQMIGQTNPALGAIGGAVKSTLTTGYQAGKRAAKGVIQLQRLWNISDDDASKLAFGIRGLAEEMGITKGVTSDGTSGSRAAKKIIAKEYKALLDSGMAPVDNWKGLTKIQQFQYINAIKAGRQ